jgi:FAD/FMN-containing dehydrogenase
MTDRPSLLVERLSAVLPPGQLLTGPDARDQAHSAWSRLGTPLALARPASTEEVAAVVRECADAGIAVVPWGGKTGLVHGTNADGAVALSLEGLSAIEELDVPGATVQVQAGCVLAALGEVVEAQGLSLPIDFGARGSATIGGILATNAGGNRVIRYGMTRDHVLGLEVVLADGTVLSGLNHCIKNNTGYDLKQWFIGSEGTLGIITRAVLRLRPLPTSHDAALVGCGRFDQLGRLLRHMEGGLGGTLSAFEVMWPEFIELVTTSPALGRSPFATSHAYAVLIEAQGSDTGRDAERFEAILATALELGLMDEAVLARSLADRAAFWALRDDIAQTARNWPIFTFDVSLRIADMESYLEEVRAALRRQWHDAATLTVFGHLGDGNLHLVAGMGSRTAESKKAVEEIVYGGIRARGGSVSAEHGIGLEKRDYLGWSRTPEEIALMRKIKALLDPKNILNPGKVIAPDESGDTPS